MSSNHDIAPPASEAENYQVMVYLTIDPAMAPTGYSPETWVRECIRAKLTPGVRHALGFIDNADYECDE